MKNKGTGAELARLDEDTKHEQNWKRWGPYLSERQWGTVREDYSANGDAWNYFPYEHSISRAYRWGEDGLLGISDRKGRLCFSLAFWNEKDPMLKERLFGLSNPQGNHGEDVKEAYFYLDSTPTHSYMKALYKYPQSKFPYQRLVEENRSRSRNDPEFELIDTRIFNDNRYFDIFAEYAKASAEDILIRITIANRGPEAAGLHFLPTLWFRNTWSWGSGEEGRWQKPKMIKRDEFTLEASHETLGRFLFAAASVSPENPVFLFTENETNAQKLFGIANSQPYVKDAFHEYVIHRKTEAVNPKSVGTKAAVYYKIKVVAGESREFRFRLRRSDLPSEALFSAKFETIFASRIQEADEFYRSKVPVASSIQERQVIRQAYAGLLWSKQFYYYSVKDWLEGDPKQPRPPEERKKSRNSDWPHLYNRDVISMPDKWEYPWYAAWDLAFHMIPFADIDPEFAKEQLLLFLREWYMHPNGQIPAYEWDFCDVNPPVHAWAAWRVYKITGRRGERDRNFLERIFQKLLLNFTWWVNRKDPDGKHLFSGGFLGLDNIGIFDRSKPLPNGKHLEQADGTAWMAFYCSTMLAMALELAKEDPVYEDIASKFFEHFVAITDAINTLDGAGLWDEADGFYYSRLHCDGATLPLRFRSTVGLIPLLAVEVLDEEAINRLPGFSKRMKWFLENRPDLASQISYMCRLERKGECLRLLAIPTRERLERVLRYVFDENEFLSPYGVRSLSRAYKEHPYILKLDDMEHRVEYLPGESNLALFGGNSNWRGPIWFPINYLLIEALERYHHYYGDSFKVEVPTGSGQWRNLAESAGEIARRLAGIFLADREGTRACHYEAAPFAEDPYWKDFILFYEYFHGDTGKGLGASHQTGWTSLIARCLQDLAKNQKRQVALTSDMNKIKVKGRT